jgi:hypothetical protein
LRLALLLLLSSRFVFILYFYCLRFPVFPFRIMLASPPFNPFLLLPCFILAFFVVSPLFRLVSFCQCWLVGYRFSALKDPV